MVQVLVEEDALRRIVREEARAAVGDALRASSTPQTLLPAREAAKRLGMSEAALRRAGQRGVVPVVKLPTGAVRFRVADLDAWIERGV